MNPRSFYECDQCKFQYVFDTRTENKFLLARLLASSVMVNVLSFVLLLVLIFVGGFVGKSFDPTLDWSDVFYCFNLNHIVAGATTTGLGSLLGWATSMGGIGGGGGWRMIIGDGWHGALGERGAGRDIVSVILTTIMVLAGLAVAFSWIYERLQDAARRTTRLAQSVVLDVQGSEGVTAPERVNEQDFAGETPTRRSARLAEQQHRRHQRAFEPVD